MLLLSESSPRQTCCPRCGYDLAGAVTLWTNACDLRGTCPECGLEFLWRDVMDPTHTVPRWLYENPFRPALGALFPTLLRMTRPMRFWRSVNLALPTRTLRLLLLMFLVVLASHVLLAGSAALSLYASLQSARGIIPALSAPPAMEMYPPVLAWPYKSHLVEFSWKPGTWGGAFTQRSVITTPAAGGADVIAFLLALVIMPLTYLLLRQTFRRTRVRASHLFRIVAYSSVLLIPAVILHILAMPEWLGASAGSPLVVLTRLHELAPDALTVLVFELIALGVWWYAATVRYLRLPHAAGVVLAMLTITGLIVMLAMVLTDGWHAFFRM